MDDKTIAIIGCGLIGGSIGLALRQRRPDWTIVGLDVAEQLPVIRAAQFADFVGTLADAPEVLTQASVVVLATPVEVALSQLADIAPYLQPGAVVTDVAGSKSAIVKRASEVLPSKVAFVGGHPVAGKEDAGIEAADPLLFKDRVYALCPRPDTPSTALLTLLDMVEDLCAIPWTVEPEEHDRILATVSHLPQLLSIALIDAALEMDASHGLLDKAAGPGFLDVTRIAASDFGQWQGVIETNQQPIVDALKKLESSLGVVRCALEQKNLRVLFERASAQRRAMTPKIRLGKNKPDLRRLIDRNDEKMMQLLGQRLKAATEIGRIKAQEHAPIYDPLREQSVLAQRRQWAKELSIPSDFVDELFEVIIRHSSSAQVLPKATD